MASPPGGVPDEPTHVITAVAVSHGQGLGSPLSASQRRDLAQGRGGGLGGRASAYRSVIVPRVYDELNWGCFAFRPQVPASCQHFRGSRASGPAVTPVEWYSPLYYAWVGTIARPFPAGRFAWYAMRLASVGLFAALLASAATSLRRLPGSRLALAGLLLAGTPMAWFLGASVNPSGIEIGAGIAMWASGVVLVDEARQRVEPRVVVRFVAAAGVLVLARHPGAIWAILIAVVLCLSATPAARRRLARSRPVRIGLGVLSLCGLGELAWVLVARPFSATHVIFTGGLHSSGQILDATVGQTGSWLHQMIGTFGWLDTPSPAVTVALWVLAAGPLFVAAAIRARRTDRAALLLTLELAFAVPVILAAVEASEVGQHWQGRYQLPFVAGLPILAAASLGRARRVPKRAVPLVGAAVVAASAVAYAQNLRRYTVGDHGALQFWLHPSWSPPIPPLLLLVGVTIAVAVLAAWFATTSFPQVRRRPSDGARAEPPVPDGDGRSGRERRGATPVGAIAATATTWDHS